VVRQVARTVRPTELQRIVDLVDALANPGLPQKLIGPVISADLDANQLGNALRIWRTLLGNDRLADLAGLTRTLNRGGSA